MRLDRIEPFEKISDLVYAESGGDLRAFRCHIGSGMITHEFEHFTKLVLDLLRAWKNRPAKTNHHTMPSAFFISNPGKMDFVSANPTRWVSTSVSTVR